ncbi:MAG TPA: hypothetical protein VHM31_14105, partial [Polyangia bacterium]|nr:hypothetical protein [Polyangia bacterium]
ATGGAGGRASTGTGGATATGGGGGRAATGTGGAAGAGAGTGGMTTSSDWGTPVSGGPSGTGVAATVTVNPATTVGTVTPGFAGLSYEKTHLTNASLIGTNTKLIALYKLLGAPQVRIGANDVDVCTWGGTGTASSTPSGQPFTHTINTGMVDQLCGFLQATGSQVMYGVNFKAGNVSQSAAEATYVMNKCGSSVYAFELGNEINKYDTWANLQQQWESMATAVTAIPGALLAGPGSTGGGYSSFTVPFTQSESAKLGSKLRLVTQHYYSSGAGSSSATASTLQNLKSDIVTMADTVNGAATKGKVPDGWRWGECNTFSGHGQMGVSDTIISALWSLDFMYLTAEHGGSGVNFHGGETGMDGTRPFYYEPIAEANGVVTAVQPLYYGMLLFDLAGTGPVVSTSVTSSNANFTAYAVKGSGHTSVVLVNRNASNGVNATVNVGAAVTSASAIYLQGTPAGSLSAGTGSVTLAGATVSTDAVWNRGAPFAQATSGNTTTVYVPPVSAALVRIVP